MKELIPEQYSLIEASVQALGNTCKVCGEDLVGDGYTTAIHCPNKDVDDLYLEPDADIVYCEDDDVDF